MKKIIKYLLIVLLIFPLYSCKDEQQIDETAINEFGITYKLENELKTAVYEKGENSDYYKKYGYPLDSLELTYYFGEIERYHTFLCYAAFELEHIDIVIPHTYDTLPYYLYKEGNLITLAYAAENNLLTEENILYINSFLWREENLDKKEAIQLKDYKLALKERLGYTYCEYKNIDTTENKAPIFKYSFEYIDTFEIKNKSRLMATLIKGNYLPFETKETIAGINFYYYDTRKIKLLGAIYSIDKNGKKTYKYDCLSLKKAYELGYITKDDLIKIKQISIENGYIKNK